MTDLKDTTEMMVSDDYKDRFYAEYWQLRIRYEKLRHQNALREAQSATGNKYMKFTSQVPDGVLKDQEKAMADYLHCLEVRAVIEGIDLRDEL